MLVRAWSIFAKGMVKALNIASYVTRRLITIWLPAELTSPDLSAFFIAVHLFCSIVSSSTVSNTWTMVVAVRTAPPSSVKLTVGKYRPESAKVTVIPCNVAPV